MQLGVPAQTGGETQGQPTIGPALAGAQAQLGQEQLLQIAAERAGQAERAGRPIQFGAEVAQVVAAAIGQLDAQSTQSHRRWFCHGIEPLPGKVLPVQAAVEAEGLTPIQLATELQAPLGIRTQAQRRDLCALAMGQAPQLQAHGSALGRQLGSAGYGITLLEVALGLQHHPVQAQGLRQLATGHKSIGEQLRLGRQVGGQRLHLGRQTALQVAAAVRRQAQATLQVAVDLHGQRPGLLFGGRQAHLAFGTQRPAAVGLQAAAQIQTQLAALRPQAVDTQALRAPMRAQLQATQLLIAIEQQPTEPYLAELYGQRQPELGQA